jgi:hypothetical protein
MMIKRGLFIGLFCSLLLNISWASPVAHPDFQAKRGETELKATATATATWLVFIDVYDAGLYAEPSAQASRLLDDKRSFALEIRYKVSLSKAQLVEGADVALGRQHTEQQRALYQADVNALHGFYQDVSEGDRFRLDIDSNNGISLFFNDELRYQNTNLDFARYYVGLWLAENPLSDSLRTGLLDW